MKLIAALIGLATFTGVACAADTMEFRNKKGTVLFDHRKHQELADCKDCHNRSGGIDHFGKAWAHRVCIGCHEPEPGKLEGPITCDGCHTGK